MHTDTQNFPHSPFDSAALQGTQIHSLFNDDGCDPMGPCQSDGNESGLKPQELESRRGGNASSAVDPSETLEEEPFEPEACDPMGPCQSDGNESGLIGDFDPTH